MCVWLCVCCLRVEAHLLVMAFSSRYPTEGNVALPDLTPQLVSSTPKLHNTLEPLLHGRVQPGMFCVVIPSVQRECGSSTKSFLFLVGFRKPHNAKLQGLFPSGHGHVP